jgi:hypothetical protein
MLPTTTTGLYTAMPLLACGSCKPNSSILCSGDFASIFLCSGADVSAQFGFGLEKRAETWERNFERWLSAHFVAPQ